MHKIAPPYTDPSYLFRHGGPQTAAERGLLDCSTNINPLGPPRIVLTALRQSLPAIARYPDPVSRDLVERLAAGHGVAPDQVVVGNGSNDLIHAIARAFRPRRVAIAEPTYTEYLRASLLAGAAVDHWLAPGNAFKLSSFDPGKAELVWLCNPNNPTGTMWASAAHLVRWARAHPRCIYVVDEAFVPLCLRDFLVLRGYPSSVIPLLSRAENLIVLRSMTKFFALPGLRLGYAVTAPELADRIRRALPGWPVNVLAQAAGLAALADRDFQGRTRDWLVAEAGFLNCPELQVPGFRPLPSSASFVLVRLHKISSSELRSRLIRRGILIRDASNFVGLDDRYVRIAVRTKEDNRQLVGALREVLTEMPSAERGASASERGASAP
jgi:threonine-phosphate decarboxylase